MTEIVSWIFVALDDKVRPTPKRPHFQTVPFTELSMYKTITGCEFVLRIRVKLGYLTEDSIGEVPFLQYPLRGA